MSPSSFRKDRCLGNCNSCGDFSGDFRNGCLIISALGCLKYGEVLVEVMADSLMTVELVFFV